MLTRIFIIHISSEHDIYDRRSCEDLNLMEDQVCAIESLLEIDTDIRLEEDKFPRLR